MNNNVKEYLDKFEKLKQKKLKIQTEQEILALDKERILKELPADITTTDLEALIVQLEKELQEEVATLNVPKEYLDELSGLDNDI